MRKRFITADAETDDAGTKRWLDVSVLAEAEVTSEDAEHPIENALLTRGSSGWKAAVAGPQIIRLYFDQPRAIRRIELTFREEITPRTQEFCLSWAESRDRPFRDLLRQQFNFSPPGTVCERELYHIGLTAVGALELRINPDINSIGAVASIDRLRVG